MIQVWAHWEVQDNKTKEVNLYSHSCARVRRRNVMPKEIRYLSGRTRAFNSWGVQTQCSKFTVEPVGIILMHSITNDLKSSEHDWRCRWGLELLCAGDLLWRYSTECPLFPDSKWRPLLSSPAAMLHKNDAFAFVSQQLFSTCPSIHLCSALQRAVRETIENWNHGKLFTLHSHRLLTLPFLPPLFRASSGWTKTLHTIVLKSKWMSKGYLASLLWILSGRGITL